MQRDKREIEAALERKGFDRDEGRDHVYFIFRTRDGKRTPVKTKTSHGAKPKSIGDDLIRAMARQCHVSTPEFLRLVDCTLDRDEYEERLRSMNRV